MSAKTPYATGTATSADGTTIGYRWFGHGPGLVLLHGGVNAAQHMMRLGGLLADAFTVYLPDRRGRGRSGPYGPAYSLRCEDEDLAAVVRTTGARFVFGPANGAFFALHGSVGLREVEKVAAYEPLLLLGQPGTEEFRRLLTTLQTLVRSGRLGEAMRWSAAEDATIEARRGAFSPTAAALLRHTPAALFDLFLRLDRSRRGDVAWRDLLAALPAELDPVLDGAAVLDDFRTLHAPVLLMHGSRSHPVFAATAHELARVLPSSTVIRLPGLDHDAAQTYGDPGAIAAATRVFLTG